jgi:hypothetical protein
MEGFTAVIAFKEDGPACFVGGSLGVGVVLVQLPAFVELGEGFTLHQGKGVESVVGFVVVEAGGHLF